MRRLHLGLALILALAMSTTEIRAGFASMLNGRPFTVTPVGQFDDPWDMTFLPDGRALVTEKPGRLKVWQAGRPNGDISGVPRVRYSGQAGLGDIILHPNFATNQIVYLSWSEPDAKDENMSGAAVGRARLVLDQAGGGRLEGLQVIWRQSQKSYGLSHYSQRLAFSPDGFLFIASGERHLFTPAQDLDSNLGKIVRLTDTGSVPSDNPFASQGGNRGQIWTLGHRNLLGLAFDSQGRLWEHEMGPIGGDELNLVIKGKNYGWPIVSEGDLDEGGRIPRHRTRPKFEAPQISWTPVIAPAGLMFYSGDLFPAWKGNAFIGGLASQSLIRVVFDGTSAREAERFDMGARIREVEQGPDGAIYALEDLPADMGGRLLKLTPKS